MATKIGASTLILQKGCEKQDVKVYDTLSVRGEKIRVTISELGLGLWVEQANTWKEVKPYDVPKELKELPNENIIEALIKTADFGVSHLSNGDCKVSVSCGLSGGMFRSDDAKQQQDYRRLVNAFNLEIARHSLNCNMLTLEGALRLIGATTLGGLAGVAGGAYTMCQMSIHAKNQRIDLGRTEFAIGVVISAVVGAVAFYLKEKDSQESDTLNKATLVKNELKGMGSTYYQIEKDILEKQFSSAQNRALKALSDLHKKGYLEFDQYALSFKKEKFEEIANFFVSSDREKILCGVQLVILFISCHLPEESPDAGTLIDKLRARPTQHIISCLESLLNAHAAVVSLEMRDATCLMLGRLNVEVKNYTLALSALNNIQSNSNLYPIAQRFISEIQEFQKMQQRLLA